MTLLSDIKKDINFSKNTKIVLAAIAIFFLCDFAIHIFITNGLEKYYGLNSPAEIALIGHSHLMLGVDKGAIENALGKKVSKYTREGVNVSDRKIMIEQLLRKNPNLKKVIYGVDAWSFTGEGLSENSYKLFYPFLGDKKVDHYIKKQANFTEYWLHKIIKTTRFNEGLISSAMRGYLGNWSNLKFGNLDVDKLKTEIKKGNFRKINSTLENITILRETLTLLKKNDVEVILLYVPTIDLYNSNEPIKFDEVISVFYDFEKEFSNVKYVSLLEPYSHDYSLFYDPIHMNPKGQEIITFQLIAYLK